MNVHFNRYQLIILKKLFTKTKYNFKYYYLPVVICILYYLGMPGTVQYIDSWPVEH